MATDFKVGDVVRTGYGEVGVIQRTRPDGEQRDGSWSDTLVYYVESAKGGSPIVWWYAEQLEPAHPLTWQQKQELLDLDRWYNQRITRLNQIHQNLDLMKQERLEALKAKHRGGSGAE